MKLKTIIACFLCSINTMLQAQDIPVGTWRTHQAYYNARKVAVAGEWVYCASENGLFGLYTPDNSLHTFGKLDGLSDNGIADLAYHAATQTLIIAYQNGNIDLMRNNSIINVRSLLNSIQPDKRIFSVTISGQIAYFATAFGGVAFDMQHLTMGDAYTNLGGAPCQGRAFAVGTDSLYLATTNGIFAVSLAPEINRQDFANWQWLEGTPNSAVDVALVGETLYYTANNIFFSYENGQSMALDSHERSWLEEENDQLLLSMNAEVLAWENGTGQLLSNSPLVQEARDAAFDGTAYWIADGQAGLVKVANGDASNFIPTGTLSAQAFRLLTAGNRIVAVSGGFDESTLTGYGRNIGFYVFENGRWRNFTAQPNRIGATTIPDIPDISAIAYDMALQAIHFGSFSEGLLTWHLADDTFTEDRTGPTSITGLVTDSQGLLWACSADGRIMRRVEGAWSTVMQANRPVDMVVDAFDNKWIRLGGGGLLLLDADGKQRHLQHQEGLGNLRGNLVRAVAIDLEGSLWAGTNNGITEFFDAYFTLLGDDGSTVFSTEGLPLHQGESVTALAVDGGNRKWVGTESSGVWLYSPQGELLAHFSAANSPLLSDQVHSIAVEPVTGEVFFATSQGIASYRGMATQGEAVHGNVKVFPNPVRPNYTGLITIAGLVNQAEVRITDTGGRLIWKGRAAGGTATWDGNNFEGQRAQTGVYLVFSADASGTETHVAKIVMVSNSR